MSTILELLFNFLACGSTILLVLDHISIKYITDSNLRLFFSSFSLCADEDVKQSKFANPKGAH